MEVKTYPRDSIIFREGDPSDCAYEIQSGTVGIFKNYGEDSEKKIAELFPGQHIGEMGLLSHAPRSATAVAMDKKTALKTVSEDEFYEYFNTQPNTVLLLMEEMCNRLRRTTRDYMEACRTVYETTQTEKAGTEKSAGLLERIRKFCKQHTDGFFADT